MLGLGSAGLYRIVILYSIYGRFGCGQVLCTLCEVASSLLFLIVFACLTPQHRCVLEDLLSFPHPPSPNLCYLSCPKFSSALIAADPQLESHVNQPPSPSCHTRLPPAGFPSCCKCCNQLIGKQRAGKSFDAKTRCCNSNGYDITQRRMFNLQETIRIYCFRNVMLIRSPDSGPFCSCSVVLLPSPGPQC